MRWSAPVTETLSATTDAVVAPVTETLDVRRPDAVSRR